MFLLSDNQILQESFLEDINSILNSGGVSSIFNPEDWEEVLSDMR